MTAKWRRDEPSQAEEAALPLDENFSYRLSMLNYLVGQRTAKIYQGEGLTAHQWKVMSVLYSATAMPAFEVARYVTLDKAAISRAVRQLLELGYAERALGRSDARRVDVSLTAKGRACYARMAARMARLQDSLFAEFGEKRKRDLFAAIDTLEAKLKGDRVPE
jgi:DNA-binding MarR family transcriptional regulator